MTARIVYENDPTVPIRGAWLTLTGPCDAETNRLARAIYAKHGDLRPESKTGTLWERVAR